MSNCWELKGCPASFYMNCPAFAEKVSCWGLGSGCCCTGARTLKCADCVIYQRHRQEEVVEVTWSMADSSRKRARDLVSAKSQGS